MLSFIRKHWAASLALMLALLTAAAAAALVVFFPPALAVLAGITVFGATPLAFLTTLALPAAAATVGALSFAASLVASSLFNAVVGIYNRLDKVITPKTAPEYEAVNGQDEDEDLEEDDENSCLKNLIAKLGCCKKVEEGNTVSAPLVNVPNHRSPIAPVRQAAQDEQAPILDALTVNSVTV